MQEYRCKFCHKLLFKVEKKATDLNPALVEIKCDKCKRINKVYVPIALVKVSAK